MWCCSTVISAPARRRWPRGLPPRSESRTSFRARRSHLSMSTTPASPAVTRLYHLDLYRLRQEDDLASIGFDDFVVPADGVTLVEWPERAATALPDRFLLIEIETVGSESRRLRFVPVPMTTCGPIGSRASAPALPQAQIEAMSRLRAVAPELAILRGIDLVILAAESNEPLQKDREEPLSLRGGCHKGIAHHPCAISRRRSGNFA